MDCIGVIPARYSSTRFEAKVLADIFGKPMIQHVWERARQSKMCDELIIACDEQKVADIAKEFGATVVMTAKGHASGTDRISEIINPIDVKVVINIQGDEPLISPLMIDTVARALLDDASLNMATLMRRIDDDKDIQDPNVVKVVVDKNNFALYFSRAAIPYRIETSEVEHPVYYKHVGLYGYTKDFLFTLRSLPQSNLEKTEKLEQLRALQEGYRIKVLETKCDTIGVDTPEDLERVKAFLKSHKDVSMRTVRVGTITIGERSPLVLIAGPCVIESARHCSIVARSLAAIARSNGVGFIFKASFDKANRMSVDSYRGPGLREGLDILRVVKSRLGIPVLSDVHSIEQVREAAEVLDVIQIPALLCRQTDLLVEAARTGKVINIKKGQFLAPWDMAPIIKKAESAGNKKILLTERGVSFGYNNLVSDLRSLAIMRDLGYPVIYDATHSVQLPGGKGSSSGGQRQFVAGLARAAVAFGCDGLFLEVHPDPDSAPCDGPNMIALKDLNKLLRDVQNIRKGLR